MNQVADFKNKCDLWQGIVDSLGRMTVTEELASQVSQVKRAWHAKMLEQENSFLQASEQFE